MRINIEDLGEQLGLTPDIVSWLFTFHLYDGIERDFAITAILNGAYLWMDADDSRHNINDAIQRELEECTTRPKFKRRMSRLKEFITESAMTLEDAASEIAGELLDMAASAQLLNVASSAYHINVEDIGRELGLYQNIIQELSTLQKDTCIFEIKQIAARGGREQPRTLYELEAEEIAYAGHFADMAVVRICNAAKHLMEQDEDMIFAGKGESGANRAFEQALEDYAQSHAWAVEQEPPKERQQQTPQQMLDEAVTAISILSAPPININSIGSQLRLHPVTIHRFLSFRQRHEESGDEAVVAVLQAARDLMASDTGNVRRTVDSAISQVLREQLVDLSLSGSGNNRELKSAAYDIVKDLSAIVVSHPLVIGGIKEIVDPSSGLEADISTSIAAYQRAGYNEIEPDRVVAAVFNAAMHVMNEHRVYAGGGIEGINTAFRRSLKRGGTHGVGIEKSLEILAMEIGERSYQQVVDDAVTRINEIAVVQQQDKSAGR